MPKIKVQQRIKSPGELSEQQRIAQYWLAREAKKIPGKHPNKNTIALRPSRFGLSEWSKETGQM